MPKPQTTRQHGIVQGIKKLMVSAFVVFTFIGYAIHDRLSSSDSAVALAPTPSLDPNQTTASLDPSATTVVPTPTDVPSATAVPASPTDVPPSVTVIVPSPTDIPASPTDEPPTATDQPSPTDVPPTPTTKVSGVYKDGQYTGAVADAFYGVVQVKAVVRGGKIADVQFLQYPQDRRTSARINSFAVPALRTEAIGAQNAKVDLISGATLTSEAFVQSLQSALNKARA